MKSAWWDENLLRDGLWEQRKKNGFGKNNDKLNKNRKVGISSFAAFVVSWIERHLNNFSIGYLNAQT